MIEISYGSLPRRFRQKSLVNENLLKKVLQSFLSRLFEGRYGLSLYITDDTEIRKLNSEFRNKDCPTDILSWSYRENETETETETEESVLAGDLAVSSERVQAQAAENGWDFEAELIRLLAHGCAHLAGWEHECSEEEARQMLKLEIELLKSVGYPEIYTQQ